MKYSQLSFAAIILLISSACTKSIHCDILIRNASIVDGTGQPAYVGDIAINSDTICAFGSLSNYKGAMEIDATGLTAAPGFINMLSWANVSLIEDGRSQGDIRQGVTLEVMGEGMSMGPLTEEMKKEMKESQQHIKYDIPWTSLGSYLNYLEAKGVSTNIASFVGNGTLRRHVIGYEKRKANRQEMEQMKQLLRQGMEEGAVGVSTSLIYVPSGHADTEEIIELAKVVAEYDGMYISHIRDEEGKLLEAVDELITIAQEANIRSEIYHFKASGNDNWHLLDSAIQRVEQARKNGLAVTTDMYMYNASSTGLNVVLPAWAKDGGHNKTMELIAQKPMRDKMVKEMDFHVPADKILLVGFRDKDMRKYIGKTLQEVVDERGTPREDTVLDLIYEDNSRIQVVYFSMSEENIEKKLKLPYMAICSDAGSYTNDGIFLEQSTHPRAYGSFARLLGHYVRDRKVVSLEEAIHRLTALPATNLKIDKRGLIKDGYYADIVLFDAMTIKDNATFAEPHQYATGMEHVLVNGVAVIKDKEHTGAFPGRVVHGPGWKGTD